MQVADPFAHLIQQPGGPGRDPVGFVGCRTPQMRGSPGTGKPLSFGRPQRKSSAHVPVALANQSSQRDSYTSGPADFEPLGCRSHGRRASVRQDPDCHATSSYESKATPRYQKPKLASRFWIKERQTDHPDAGSAEPECRQHPAPISY